MGEYSQWELRMEQNENAVTGLKVNENEKGVKAIEIHISSREKQEVTGSALKRHAQNKFKK